MAISRMQEPQQLDGILGVGRVPAAFGGIMDSATGRRAYGLGSVFKKITRPIKKAAKVVKKVAKSDIGKLALLYAAGAGLGGSTALGGAGGSFFSRLANPSNLLNLKNVFGSKALNLPGISGVGGEGIGRFFNPFNKANPLFFKGGDFSATRAGITASALSAVLPFLAPDLFAPKFEDVEEENIDITQTPESIALLNQRARDFYNYGDPDLMFMPRKEYVMRNFYAAEGGSVPESKVKGYDTPAGFNKFDYPTGGVEVRTPKKEGGKLTQYDRSKAGSVMRPKFEKGGLMDLGGLEMDFRANGGFVPIGSKEKADDVPARLSKNEFVMTADAVRGAGNGSIKAGAQKMYDTMKQLENRVV